MLTVRTSENTVRARARIQASKPKSPTRFKDYFCLAISLAAIRPNVSALPKAEPDI